MGEYRARTPPPTSPKPSRVTGADDPANRARPRQRRAALSLPLSLSPRASPLSHLCCTTEAAWILPRTRVPRKATILSCPTRQRATQSWELDGK